jgi:omega-6 fatty acid desaturase (delta-12 desaturase)
VFLQLYRIPFDVAGSWRGERRALHVTNLALACLFIGLGLAIGFGRVLAVQLPIIVVASILGVWLFSVQHRFEHTLWVHDANWSFTEGALRGSSYLRLPRILQWFTGNIGFHHIHHLNPRIPNYRLEDCHGTIGGMKAAPILTLRTSHHDAPLRAVGWRPGRMVKFCDIRDSPPVVPNCGIAGQHFGPTRASILLR